MTKHSLSPLVIAAALAACNPAPDAAEPVSNASDPGNAAAVGAPGASSTPSPTPAPAFPAEPAPLSERDVADAALPGELACSFTDGSGRPLLIARGIVGASTPAAAIAKIGVDVVRLSAPGGFNAIVKGANFRGEALGIRIEPAGPVGTGGESPPLPATLTLERGGAALVTTSGDWTCGP